MSTVISDNVPTTDLRQELGLPPFSEVSMANTALTLGPSSGSNPSPLYVNVSIPEAIPIVPSAETISQMMALFNPLRKDLDDQRARTEAFRAEA